MGLLCAQAFCACPQYARLLDEVIKYAAALGVKRVSWDVLDWNTPAIEFYEHKGADVKRDWDVVHLNEEGIKNYLAKLDTCKS